MPIAIAPNEQEVDDPQAVADRMVADRQWPVVVALSSPVDFGSQRIASLEFRRGKMGDLKGLSPGIVPPFEQLAMLASRMCGQPIRVIESLADDDWAEVQEIALGFFTRCHGAGRKR